MLASLVELGQKVLDNPACICIEHPAIDADGNPVEPQDYLAVAWSMWDLLFLISRKYRKTLPLPMFMEQMRCVVSNIIEEDVITWQYKQGRTHADILELVSLLINLMSQRVGVL